MEAIAPNTPYEYPLATSPAVLVLDINIDPIMDRSASAPPPSSSSSFFLTKFLPFASKHHHHHGSSAVLDTTNHSGAPSICTTSDDGFASSSAADKLTNAPASPPKMFKSLTEDNNSISSDDEHKHHQSPVSSFRRRASRYLFRSRRHHHQRSSSRSMTGTMSSSPNTFHGPGMDQEEEEEVENHHHDYNATVPNEENFSTASSLDEPPTEIDSYFYRMDDRFARCLNECDPIMLPELRRKRDDTPIVIREPDDNDDELKNGDVQAWLLMQSLLQVETNAMLKASMYTSCTNRRIVMLGPKKSSTPTESIPFVVQHIGHYQRQPYDFSYPSG